MIRYEFKPSFDRSVKALNQRDKKAIKNLCELLIDVLAGKTQLSKGAGLKRLKNDFWEIRRGIKQRIIFQWQNDDVKFILAGNHDRIRKFLREN
jgi:mRNA-degrading endonuclease RelE of RelBE toxin-antitoxin system